MRTSRHSPASACDAPTGSEGGSQGHIPVLLDRVLEFLAPERGGLFVDATVGLGGHAEALLEASPRVQLIGVDRDPQALARARQRLEPFGDRARLVRGRFGTLGEVLRGLGIDRVSGWLADFGVSSMQLDVADRGFAFGHDGPLDMRMGRGVGDELDESQTQTAAMIVNREPEDALTKIFSEYGEERHARRVSRAIAQARRAEPIETTAQLANLVERAKPGERGPRRRHPATQVFQALRIAVNRELDEVGGLMNQAANLLERDGRLAVISYHSLEDRAVKNGLRDLATGTIDPVTGRPHAETRVIEVLTKKPVRPSADEVARNPRSRSARLRAGRRL